MNNILPNVELNQIPGKTKNMNPKKIYCDTNKKTPIVMIMGFLFLLPLFTIAQVNQEWAQTYAGPAKGMDEGHAIATDISGNVFITGASINSNGDLDIITIMYNNSGTLLWKQIFNGEGNEDDNGKAITVDNSGNVFVAGYSTGKGTNEDMIVIKYDKSGNLLWSQTYNGSMDSSDQASAIALDAQGNVFITGFSSNKGTGTDITTLKYDNSGKKLWVKTYNGTANENDAARGIVVDPSGNAYITGYSVNKDTYYDITTIKYSPAGDELWAKSFNGKADDYDEGNAITIDDKGNVYVSGFTDVSDKRNDLIVLKYSPAGDEQWHQTYSGKGNDDEGRAIAFSSDKIYVTGHTTNKNGDYDILTICYNTSGTQQWIQTYGGDLKSDDEGIAITADVAGSCYVTGYANNISLSETIATIKYNSSGGQQWIKTFRGSENYDDYPFAIAIDKTGNIFVSGATNYDIINNTNDGDIILIKYSSEVTKK